MDLLTEKSIVPGFELKSDTGLSWASDERVRLEGLRFAWILCRKPSWVLVVRSASDCIIFVREYRK